MQYALDWEEIRGKDRKTKIKLMNVGIKQFAEELATLTDKAKFSETLQKYFDFISKFYKYSWNNRILIYSQNPNASLVAGLRTWSNEFKRTVRAGEKAIWIYAPRFYKEENEYLVEKENGESELKKETTEHIFFVPVPVFDVSQTHGEELPTIDYNTNGESHKDTLKQLENICKSEGFSLSYKDLGNGFNGLNRNKEIIINSKLSIDDKATTIMHELTHGLLHWDKNRGEYSKKQKETEAEATTFIICRFLNIETKAYNYLALYNSNHDLILNSLERISKAVSQILNHFNESKKVTEITVTH